MSKATVFIKGLEVVAFYDFFKSWPGSQEEPPEDEIVDVWGIEIDGFDMTDYLNEAFYELVSEAVMQSIYDNGE